MFVNRMYVLGYRVSTKFQSEQHTNTCSNLRQLSKILSRLILIAMTIIFQTICNINFNLQYHIYTYLNKLSMYFIP